MGFIEDELVEVKKLCEHLLSNCKLVSCVKTMVRVEIKKSECKSLVVCIQFPENYPNTALLLELKSKTLSDKLLRGLCEVCEQEIKKFMGKPQVLKALSFLKTFIEEHPLCCCYDEINLIKRKLNAEDELKLRQKNSTIVLKIAKDGYYLATKIVIPDNYPAVVVNICDIDTNFSPAFNSHLSAQAKEIARRCVEPPLRKKKPNEPPFKPSPSLHKSVAFLIDCVKRLPMENCQFCDKQCFPSNPELLEKNENSPQHVERVYCGHLFHQECLFLYMKMPPFGNKTCKSCGHRIHHPKWSLSDKLAEDRWAHEQARERELAEVEDFFK